jgi:hypothetical protein
VFARLTIVALILGVVATPLAAQQPQLDLHGNFVVGTSTHLKSWGAGVGVQKTFGASTDPVRLSLAPSLDVVKQEHDGPTQTTLSVDLDAQPGGNSTVTPYVGLSAGSNWSGGDARQWEGARLGIEMLGGLTAKLSSSVSVKAEERFGYVNGQEHTLTTRAGVLVSF